MSIAATCGPKTQSLARYPATFIKSFAEVECVANAHRVSSDFTAWCDSNGNWPQKTIICECDQGYRMKNERQSCEG